MVKQPFLSRETLGEIQASPEGSNPGPEVPADEPAASLPPGTPPPAQQVADAMLEFQRFEVPELRQFLKRNQLQVGGLRINLLERIEDHLRDGSVPLASAYAYIDEFKEHGEQHLFLFRLQQAHRVDLEKLRREYGGRPDGHGEDPPLLQAPQPMLAAVYRRRIPRDELLFKWVETRAWSQQVALGRGQFEKQPRSERSVNFFRVDLQTGDAEIRIQKLQANPEKTLLEELEIYRQQIRRLVDLDHFSPLVLEPVIRRLLTSRKMLVQRWQIDWREGGRLGGNVDPGFVQGLLLRFANYFALEMAGDWLFGRNRGQPKKVRASLDGRTNEVEIPNRCAAEEEEVILRDIRGMRRRSLQIHELGRLAHEREEWRSVLETFDLHLSTLGKRELELDKLRREWAAGPQSLEAAQELASRFPEHFHLRYRVRCPDTGKLVEQSGKTLWYDRRDAVPDEIACRHARGRRLAVHPTGGNVEAVLAFEPPAETPALVPKLTSMIERWLPQGLAQRVIGGVAILLFTLLFVSLVCATTWAFLRLGEQFQTGLGVLFVGIAYTLVLLLETGIVVVVLGDPVAQQAVTILISLASLLKPRSKLKEDQPPTPKIHKVAQAHRPPSGEEQDEAA